MTRSDFLTVCVDWNLRGGWEVEVADEREPVTCESLDDARRVGYLYAARRQPCELVIRDAYHRVIDREMVRSASLEG